MSLTGAVFRSFDRTAKSSGVPLSPPHDQRDGHSAGSPSKERQHDRATASGTLEKKQSNADPDNSHGADLDERGDATPFDDTDDTIEQHRRNSLVQELARKYTAQSHRSGVAAGAYPFGDDADHEFHKDGPLDPRGSGFNARAWARAVVDYVAAQGGMFRKAGVAFENVNVHGFGSETDYQKNILNVWLGVAGVVRRLAGGWNGEGRGRRIDILRDFDGVVRDGEMLVVLGPPGSGCTTLLKTIAGETGGIFLGEGSYFNYRGELTHFLPPLKQRDAPHLFSSCFPCAHSVEDLLANAAASPAHQASARQRCILTTAAKPSTPPKSTYTFPCSRWEKRCDLLPKPEPPE